MSTLIVYLWLFLLTGLVVLVIVWNIFLFNWLLEQGVII